MIAYSNNAAYWGCDAMTSETPRTESGMRLASWDHNGSPMPIANFERTVRAIEEESWNAALREVEEAIGALRRDRGDDDWDTVVRQEVFVAIASLRKPVTP